MKVIIIGLGSIAKKHIIALKEYDKNIEIVALRHSNKSSKYEGVRDIYSFEDIFLEKPDFVIVSNPTNKHYTTLLKLSECKIPLFIEKPVFANIGEQQKKLVEEIAENVPTYVACNLRFQTGLIKMRELLYERKIEEVNSYCGSYLPNWRPNVDFRKVYSANAEMGGGVHIDLIHELDYLYWIFGKPQFVKSIFKNNSTLGITAIDYANYLLEYDVFCANVVLNYYRKDVKRTFEVLTDKGTYELDLITNSIKFNGEIIFVEEEKELKTYIAQMKFFIEEVLKGNKFNNIQEGYKILELCLED